MAYREGVARGGYLVPDGTATEGAGVDAGAVELSLAPRWENTSATPAI